MKKANSLCVECGGTGKVPRMEAVYPNEPHMADVGEQKCICTLDTEDDMDDDSDLAEDMAVDMAVEAGLTEDEAERMVSDLM